MEHGCCFCEDPRMHPTKSRTGSPDEILTCTHPCAKCIARYDLVEYSYPPWSDNGWSARGRKWPSYWDSPDGTPQPVSKPTQPLGELLNELLEGGDVAGGRVST